MNKPDKTRKLPCGCVLVLKRRHSKNFTPAVREWEEFKRTCAKHTEASRDKVVFGELNRMQRQALVDGVAIPDEEHMKGYGWLQ